MPSPENTILFEIYRGDDIAWKVQINDSEGNPVDITDWTFRATMKLNVQDGDDVAALAVDVEPLSGDNAAIGLFFLHLPSEKTSQLLPTRYFFDLQRQLANMVSTVIRGRVQVIADVTRRIA